MASDKKTKANPKRPRDLAQLARSIVLEATGEALPAESPPEKDPAATSLGSRGGKARARNLSKEQLSEAGKKAAKARWANKSD